MKEGEAAEHSSVGYPGTPLPKKLGIGPGCRLRIVGGPDDFWTWIADAPPGVVDAGNGLADVVVFFVVRQEELVSQLDGLIASLADRGGLWIAWPKKASKVPTDITENVLRDIILPTGLVDNKVCAISQVWSGLRFVRRRSCLPSHRK